MLIKLPQEGFGGIAPRIDPQKLGGDMAQTAQDVNLIGGTLDPYKGVTAVQALDASNYKSLYKYRATAGNEWLYWTEEDISVVENPVAEDQYERIYWTGEDDKLKVKGTFGTRDVGLLAPTVAPSIALADQYTPSWSGQTYITRNAGANIEQDAMTLGAVTVTDVGYDVTFLMSELQYTSTDAPTFKFQIKINGVGAPDWQDYTNIGDKTALTDNGVTYAEIEIRAILGSTTATNDGGGPPPTYTWTEREVTFHINMNYRLQTDASYYYLYTYVDDLGQESGPGELSELITRNAEERATVSYTASSDPYADKIRIYRTANSETLTSGFYFVAEVDNATSSYIDWSRDEDLVEQLQLHDTPVDGMNHLVVMPGGFAMAAKGKTLHVSEQYLLYSWRVDYDINFDSNIKALSVAGNECVVLTDNKQYLVTGDTPSTLTSSRLMTSQTCVTSNRGVTVVGHRTLFPSPDGYVEVYGGQANLITESVIQPRDWSSYQPSTFIAETYNKKLFAKSDNIFFVMDFDEGRQMLTTMNYSVQALYYDSIDDTLYGIIDDDIVSLDTNATTFNDLVWKSKEFWNVRPWRPAVVRVEAQSYPASPDNIIFRLYAEGIEVLTLNILSESAIKIPLLRKEQKWSFQVESSVEIYDIQVSTSIGELQ